MSFQDSSLIIVECELSRKKMHVCILSVHTRDYIITSSILSNASRPGSIWNITLSRFRAANLDENGLYIVFVTGHKTAATSGPPAVVSIPELYLKYRIFVQKIETL